MQRRGRPDERAPASIIRLRLPDSDAAIVAALLAGRPEGGAALYERYAGYVRRVLTRVLGPDTGLRDLMQDVFLAAIDGIARLDEPEALRGWLAGICVMLSRNEIRRRARQRWFPLFASDDLPEIEQATTEPEVDAAVRATYRVLAKLPVDERVPFALRFIEGMELVEVADACGVSLATAKRRLVKAQQRFSALARTCPELADWVGGER